MRQDIENRIEELEKEVYELQYDVIFSMVAAYFQDQDKAKEWIGTENLNFGGTSPREMLEKGQFNKLKKFLVATLIEGY